MEKQVNGFNSNKIDMSLIVPETTLIPVDSIRRALTNHSTLSFSLEFPKLEFQTEKGKEMYHSYKKAAQANITECRLLTAENVLQQAIHYGWNDIGQDASILRAKAAQLRATIYLDLAEKDRRTDKLPNAKEVKRYYHALSAESQMIFDQLIGTTTIDSIFSIRTQLHHAGLLEEESQVLSHFFHHLKETS